MKNLRKRAIISGNFTGNGNFSGYTLEEGRVFIHKKQMEQLGWTKDADVKYPFYAVVTDQEITPFDENGKEQVDSEGNPVKVLRTQAKSAFKTKAELVQAFVDSASLDIEITTGIKAAATTAQLNDKELALLLENLA